MNERVDLFERTHKHAQKRPFGEWKSSETSRCANTVREKMYRVTDISSRGGRKITGGVRTRAFFSVLFSRPSPDIRCLKEAPAWSDCHLHLNSSCKYAPKEFHNKPTDTPLQNGILEIA
jgi:hypothetical protein